jgi:hypothetical protein
MKQVMLLGIALTLCMTLNAQTKEQTRAKQGDMVWLIVNHIKDESKTAYVDFMNTHFLPLLSHTTDETVKKQYQSTRWLEPARQNADKTWTYVFIMDPVIPKTNYNITALLATKYGAEKAAALNKEYESYFATPTVAHVLKQTQH